jgi:hypothetical protein
METSTKFLAGFIAGTVGLGVLSYLLSDKQNRSEILSENTDDYIVPDWNDDLCSEKSSEHEKQ